MGATRFERLGSISTSPSAARRTRASRTGVALRPSQAATSPSLSWAPGASRPVTMASRSWSDAAALRVAGVFSRASPAGSVEIAIVLQTEGLEGFVGAGLAGPLRVHQQGAPHRQQVEFAPLEKGQGLVEVVDRHGAAGEGALQILRKPDATDRH